MLIQRGHDEDTVPELKVINGGYNVNAGDSQQDYLCSTDSDIENNPYYSEDLEEIMKSFVINEADLKPKKE